MIIDQDRNKKVLPLTLTETKCSRKRKTTRPVETFLKPYCSRKPKPSYKNIITIADSDVEIIRRRMALQKVMDFVSY